MKRTTKRCWQCGGDVLRAFQSLRKKQCDRCLAWMPWELEEGQAPLVGASRDRATDLSRPARPGPCRGSR